MMTILQIFQASRHLQFALELEWRMGISYIDLIYLTIMEGGKRAKCQVCLSNIQTGIAVTPSPLRLEAGWFIQCSLSSHGGDSPFRQFQIVGRTQTEESVREV